MAARPEQKFIFLNEKSKNNHVIKPLENKSDSHRIQSK